MSLDKNLFTLHITPNKDDPNVVDLIDPNGTIHYRKQRVVGTSYKAEVYGTQSCSEACRDYMRSLIRRSYVRVTADKRNRSKRDFKTQNIRALQPYHPIRVEAHWNFELQVGFQVGRVSNHYISINCFDH